MTPRDLRLPKDWARTPRAFGADAGLEWWPPPSGSGPSALQARAARRAAALQHEVAFAANARLLRCGYKDLTALAKSDLGISYPQLHKIMRGAAPMTLKHIAVLEERLGPLLVVKLTSPGD